MNACAASPNLDCSLLQSFLDAVPDACAAIDHSRRVIGFNPAWKALVRETAVNGSTNDPVVTDYLALLRQLSVEELACVQTGITAVSARHHEQFEYEYVRVMHDVPRYFRMQVRRCEELGADVVIFHREITLEKSWTANERIPEMEFRSLADSFPIPMWTSGPDMGCTFFNRQWLDFTGISLVRQLGNGWQQLVHPEDRGRLLRIYSSAFERKREFDLQCRLRYRDGGYRWMKYQGHPRLDSRNQMSGFSGSALDLSDQKRAFETEKSASRYVQIVKDIATVANSATTMREALQRSVQVICETMGFAIGHAFLVNDDEPELDRSSHIMHVKDRIRFAELIEIGKRIDWNRRIEQIRTTGKVWSSGKPVVLDASQIFQVPTHDPRVKAAIEAGLRSAVQLPVVVDDKVEAILEFAGDGTIAASQELLDALVAASERLSRFFERRRAHIIYLQQQEELRASAERLFAMAGRLIDSQEAERHRIAREIHDDFTQRLAIVCMQLSALTEREHDPTSAEISASLEDARKSICSVSDDLRDLSHHLRPATLELLGLLHALRAQCADFQRLRKVKTTFEATASDHDASPEAAICLYRVLQEGLTNIAKHSGSGSASVSLTRQGDYLELRIRDQGRGFVSSESGGVGIGLMNIRDRMRLLGGDLILNSCPGNGTEVVVRVPAAGRVEPPHSLVSGA